VTGGVGSCANVLQSPRFRRAFVVVRAGACWAVMRRLVGKLAAGQPLTSAIQRVALARQSLEREHPYQREVETAADLAEEVASFPISFNEIRPHKSLGQRPPLAAHLGEPHLFRG
jgi:hypothetical protein